MERPTTRVLAVLELLQTHGTISGPELSRRLGVDGRTLRRYIAMLEELGIPITADRGRYGGYSLVAGFKLPPMMFTDDEALALSLGLLAARSLGLAGAAPAVASAQAKLERVMPSTLKRRVRAIDESVALDLTQGRSVGNQAAGDDNAALTILSAAAQARERVHLIYRDGQGQTSERDFDPYGLAWRGGRWYVVGFCHLRQGERSFRLDRVEAAWPRQVVFARPDRFDALGHLSRSIATLPRTFTIEVWLEADLKAARREMFETVGVFEPEGEGTVLFAQADDLGWFARELARLPFDFEIRHPAALRSALLAHAQRLSARFVAVQKEEGI